MLRLHHFALLSAGRVLRAGKAFAVPPLALVMALSLATLAPAAQAQYKWKDERGQVHLSDLPPPSDVPERNILQRPRSARSAGPAAAASVPSSAAEAQAAPSAPGAGAGATSSAASAPVDPELAKRRAAAEAAAQAQANADQKRQQAQRAQNCQRARQQIALVQNGQRLVRINPAGERVVMDEPTRQAELQMARRVADADCR